MRAILTSSAIAFAVLLAAPAGVASAQDFELHLGNDGPRLRMRDDCDPYGEDCQGRGDYRRDRDGDRWAEWRQCTPGRALDKAERMGIWRARIGYIGRRSIEVIGRSDGERVSVRFDRWDRHCPLLD